MRYVTLVVIAAWTTAMTVIFGCGLCGLGVSLKYTVIDGKSTLWGSQPMSWTASLVTNLLFFGIYLGFSGGCILAGVKLMRALGRRQDTVPEIVPAPRPRGDTLIIRRPGFPFIPFFVLVAVIGWLCVLGGVADGLGWIPTGNQSLVPIVVGAIFAAIGHGILFAAVSITFDLRQRTWRVVRGVWPLRLVKSGDLDEASKLAVAEETRDSEDGTPVTVIVARLEWSDPSRRPLLLNERPDTLDGLRRPMGSMKLDYRPAVRHWALELADLLALSLVDDTNTVKPHDLDLQMELA